MKRFCMKLGPILPALLCLLLAGLLAGCTKAGISVTAYRGLDAVPNPWYDSACADASVRGHYRFFFVEEDAMWYFNLECNCGGQ